MNISNKKYSGFIYYHISDPDAAADLAGDVFERVIQTLPRYPPDRPFAAWLFQITLFTTLLISNGQVQTARGGQGQPTSTPVPLPPPTQPPPHPPGSGSYVINENDQTQK